MSDEDRPILNDLRREFASLRADLRESAALRWRLARMELASDLRRAARLAVVWAVALVMGLTSLPLLVVWLAGRLDGWLGVAEPLWLAVFGLALLVGAMVLGYVAWRRFRRRFLGLEQTLEELREDLSWLGERFRRDR
ncbi:MAG: phage holin family protein [Pirellulales bacterium]|nr:phage holin family protein [Pirellulales bacterium]